jgi:GntR family transcriptional repressor for pyruvate dehydrogenase complex
MFELRKLIEPHIAALAAERATPRDIARLNQLLDDQRRQIDEGHTGVDADTDFHFAIGKSTQNKALEKLVSGLMDILSHSREESLQTPGRRTTSLDSHRAIVTAIENHDEAEARAAMLRHIQQVEMNIFSAKKKPSSGQRAKKSLL